MEPSYSVWADWLSKFQTSPEAVQALWILSLTVTALGLIAGTTRVLVAIAGIFQRRERVDEAGPGWHPVESRAMTLLPEREPVAPALNHTSQETGGWRIKPGHDDGGCDMALKVSNGRLIGLRRI